MAQESLGKMNPMKIGVSSSSVNDYIDEAVPFVSKLLSSDSYNRKCVGIVMLFAIIGLFVMMPQNDDKKDLRSLIHTTSMTSKSLETIKTSNLILVTDDPSGFEFVVSIADRKSSKKPTATGVTDPLSLEVIDKDLVVDSFGGYSLVLNKFNTIEDHCLLITDAYVHQLSPLRQLDLDLWISILESIDGIGFYNSNFISGASQVHKHMQLIPNDSLRKFRNAAVANHPPKNNPSIRALPTNSPVPLESAIAAARKILHWQQYPFAKDHFQASSDLSFLSGSSKDSDSNVAQETTLADPLIYQIPQFKFRHSLALLYPRAAFSAYQHDSSSENIVGSILSSSYGSYLLSVYEALLTSQGLSLSMLKQCSSQLDPLAPSPSSSSTSSSQPLSSSLSSSTCMKDCAYNLILTPSFMLLVPRSTLSTTVTTTAATAATTTAASTAASTAGTGIGTGTVGVVTVSTTVNVNSFGVMGLLMVDSVVVRDMAIAGGLMGVLEGVSVMQ
jgi:ATP adenylyltransferase/5',5'''-P-1,P-4-tetraphosphate phosphorylase II